MDVFFFFFFFSEFLGGKLAKNFGGGTSFISSKQKHPEALGFRFEAAEFC